MEEYIDLKWKSQLFDSQLSFKIKPQNKNNDLNKFGSGNEGESKNEANFDNSENDLTPRYNLTIFLIF